VSQTLTACPKPPAATSRPSGEKATARISSVRPASEARSLGGSPVRSQSFTSLGMKRRGPPNPWDGSPAPEANVFPSGENASEYTLLR
jgi:hypothetical protein